MSTELKTVLPSAARTTAQSVDILNEGGRKYLHLIIDVTAITATPVLTVTIRGKDPVSGKYYDLLVATTITAVSTRVLKVGPAMAAVANLVADDVVPRSWTVEIAVADTDSATYTVVAQLND